MLLADVLDETYRSLENRSAGVTTRPVEPSRKKQLGLVGSQSLGVKPTLVNLISGSHFGNPIL